MGDGGNWIIPRKLSPNPTSLATLLHAPVGNRTREVVGMNGLTCPAMQVSNQLSFNPFKPIKAKTVFC